MKANNIFLIAVAAIVFGVGGWLGYEKFQTSAIKLKDTGDGTAASSAKNIRIPTINNLMAGAEQGLKTTQADSLIAFLETAKTNNINAADVSPFKTTLNSGERLTEEQKSQLKQAAIEYSKKLNGGNINWQHARLDWDMRPNTSGYAAGLEQAIANDTVEQWINAATPDSDQYKALVKAREFYANAVNNGGFVSVAALGDLKMGTTNPQVAILRNRLAQENYTTNSASPEVFDGELQQKLKLFQKAHNLKESGDFEAKTKDAMQVSAKDRLAQIDLNIERARWLPKGNPNTRIEANIASQRLQYVKDGAIALEMPVIVGKNETKTPILASTITNIVFNPSWYKPPSIKGRQRVQPPGPRNSLGRVKFNFDNSHSVYLHDTPNHYLFSVGRRTLSHGCVRLHYPKELASLLLAPQGYDLEKIQEITSTVRTTPVKLNNTVPVMIVYRTAFVDTASNEGGIVHFAPDVYNWDKLLTNLLDNNPNNDYSTGEEGGKDKLSVAAP